MVSLYCSELRDSISIECFGGWEVAYQEIDGILRPGRTNPEVLPMTLLVVYLYAPRPFHSRARMFIRWI
jgi:hypothetical protein